MIDEEVGHETARVMEWMNECEQPVLMNLLDDVVKNPGEPPPDSGAFLIVDSATNSTTPPPENLLELSDVDQHSPPPTKTTPSQPKHDSSRPRTSTSSIGTPLHLNPLTRRNRRISRHPLQTCQTCPPTPHPYFPPRHLIPTNLCGV
jgi:hypothetical protein